jgi:predicted house-cleaning noncanonical NTP pyrophosphatase (MazG superfamily)
MKRVYYHKLVRDRIPEKIAREGSGKCKTRVMGVKEFEKELIKKVAEEARGMQAAKTREELITELADVVAVIDEVRRFKRITIAKITGA